MRNNKYISKPLDTSKVKLSADLLELTELLAKNTHDIWAKQRLRALIKQNMDNDEIESYYFYGVNMASFGKTMLLGVFATLSQKYFICNVTNKGIHFYGLTPLGKPKDYSFVPKSAIKSLKVTNGLLGLTKVIEIEYTQGGKMKITANKQIRGIKEQGKNLEAIAEMRI